MHGRAMKNIIIFVLAVAVIIAGYTAATARLRMSLEGIEGRTERIIRGDLTLPIDAVGEIKPARRIEIKSEASGEVIEIARQAGDSVLAGDLLIRLQKDDEQRNADRARLELDVAEARREEARLRYEQSKTADLAAAQATVEQFEQQVELAKFRWDRLIAIRDDQKNEEEMVQRKTTYKGLVAQLAAARADLERAKIAIPRAEQLLKQAEASVETARTTLADALKRLDKTDIVAPINGIVSRINTQIGEVIQGGKTTLTGGTVLAVLLDMDRLVIGTEVDEADIGRVLAIAPYWAVPGRPADVHMPSDLRAAAATLDNLPSITVESYRDREFKGIIERVYPEPRSVSGVVTYNIDVVLSGEGTKMLLPGMRADVRFTSEHVSNALLCPNEAIREGPMGKLGVYVPKPGSSPQEHDVQFVPCLFGLDNGNFSEVREGLAEGDEVYTRLPRKRDDDGKRSG
jgi:multidrug efflux pump subunit AcrA (membrane-fusion protein)